MPIKKVGSKYKYGDSGKLYDTKEDAIRQMKAIHANDEDEDDDEKRRKKAAKKRAAEMVAQG